MKDHAAQVGRGRVALAIGAAAALAVAAAGHAAAERRDARTQVSIWRAGGSGYGGGGAFVSHRREVEVAADGVVRFVGVAAGLDPATVEVTSVTDPSGTSVLEQRFAANLATPEALLARHVGRPITVVLSRGEVRGTLRAVTLDALVIETAGKGVEIVRRGEHVVALELGAADVEHEPTLVWKLAARRPGRHTLEVRYRAAGLGWTPEYTAVLGAGDAVDLTAWAAVRNDAGLALTAAELTLVSDPAGRTPRAPATGRPAPIPLARPVDVPAGATVQVELAPRRTAVKGRRLVMFEALADQTASFPQQDCHGFTAQAAGVRSQHVLELDGPGRVLPEGTVRLLRRDDRGALTALGEDTLRVDGVTGALRLRIGAAPELVGERRQLDCREDPGRRAVRERIEVKVENRGKVAADVVVREYLYRWHNWRIDQEDEPGKRAGASAHEWRLRLPAGATRTLSYTVVYAW
ncbi:MAG: DUF4139 domain-containing protein [Myxococcales bacterium]|nr:DUF4139 domain-containing protein [Myxococcales bacterium]